MELQPYLYFGGRCEEAIEFYKKTVGATVERFMRFDESPQPTPEGAIPKDWGQKVMHATLRLGDSILMASDGCGATKFDGFALSVNVANDAEAKRTFAALSEGGKVCMPLNKTFFASSFGMLTDKFGVSWMVIVMLPHG